MTKTRSLIAALALAPSLLLAGGFRTGGAVTDDNARTTLQTFVDQFLPVAASVQDAKGGWGLAGGANPGAALAKGAVAVGGHAEVNGAPAELVVAAAKAVAGARQPGQVGQAMAVAGACGGMRVSRPDVAFPGSAEEAQALFDQVLGADARQGKTFQKRTISGTTFWGHQEWLPAPGGQGKFRRTRWVSNFQGVTRVGVGAGSGLLSVFAPLY